MGLNYAVMSEGYVPAYQISAIPFVTSSAVTTLATISFPFVTRFFTVQNHSSIDLRVGFTELGVKGTNYFIVHSASDYTGEFKIDRLFVSSSTGASISYSVIGGLTSIPTTNFHIVTGSDGYAGVG